jgi:hypothetical protein
MMRAFAAIRVWLVVWCVIVCPSASQASALPLRAPAAAAVSFDAATPSPYTLDDAVNRIAALEQQVELLALLVATLTAAPAANDAPQPLHTRENFSAVVPPVPPLDSPVVWARQHDEDGTFMTHQTLSIIQKETATRAFPWPVYIELDAAQEEGDAVGVYVRKNSTGGGGWSAAYHTDLYNTAAYHGTTIGANIEVVNPNKPAARAIGVNVLGRNDNGGMGGDAAVNVQGGNWTFGVHLDVTSYGDAAIKVDGNWSTGLHLGGNRVVLDVVDDYGGEEVSLQYDRKTKSVVLLRGQRVLWGVKAD